MVFSPLPTANATVIASNVKIYTDAIANGNGGNVSLDKLVSQGELELRFLFPHPSASIQASFIKKPSTV